jgi:hypothetical protein
MTIIGQADLLLMLILTAIVVAQLVLATVTRRLEAGVAVLPAVLRIDHHPLEPNRPKSPW